MGKKLIYISTRRNLVYVLYLIIFYYLRKAVLLIISTRYEFNDSLIFTFLMLLGEFCAGLSLYMYNRYLLKKEKININVFGLKLIQKEAKMKRSAHIIIIYILIFFSAFFDFVEFIIATFYIPKFEIVSPTAEYRFGGVIIIIGALLCYYNLKIPLRRHHLVSLITIGIALIIIIVLEIIFRGRGVPIGDFVFPHILVIGYLIFVPFTDIIEKYLMEFNFMNPFFILMMESIFGFILIIIYSIGEDPFKDTRRLYKECSAGDFTLLIFLLFLYFAFSAGTNVYKIITNGLYSPMAKTLAVYILNPLIYTYHFVREDDFLLDKERNLFYFLVNIFIAVIISFFGCVFNEFIVLSFCKLDYETHHEITRRASETTEDKFRLMDDLDSTCTDQ